MLAHITIAPVHDDLFIFEGRSFPLRYESGVFENLRDAEVEVGETVSLEASIIVDDTLLKRPSIGYNKAQLVVPSDRRQEEYDELRATVRDDLDTFELHAQNAESPKDFVEARKLFASLRRLALTQSERSRLGQIVREMPAGERPIHEPHYTSTRGVIEKAFGVNFEELNAREYLTFARRVLHGEIPNSDKPDRADQSYLFRLLDRPPFTMDQFVELVFSTLRIRIARLELTGDSHDEYWDDYYLVEQCLTYLETIEDPHVVEALAWMIDYCLERGYFDDRLSRSERYAGSRKFGSFLEKAIRSLADGSRYNGVRAPANFDFGRMQAWNNTLAAFPFMDHVAARLRQSLFGAWLGSRNRSGGCPIFRQSVCAIPVRPLREWLSFWALQLGGCSPKQIVRLLVFFAYTVEFKHEVGVAIDNPHSATSRR